MWLTVDLVRIQSITPTLVWPTRINRLRMWCEKNWWAMWDVRSSFSPHPFSALMIDRRSLFSCQPTQPSPSQISPQGIPFHRHGRRWKWPRKIGRSFSELDLSQHKRIINTCRNGKHLKSLSLYFNKNWPKTSTNVWRSYSPYIKTLINTLFNTTLYPAKEYPGPHAERPRTIAIQSISAGMLYTLSIATIIQPLFDK
jgi:hypothetical protein